MHERRAAKNLIFPKWAGIAHSQAEQGCKYSFNRIMRLSDQQQLEIRSLPSQCMRSKFLPLLPWPTWISPLSSCRDDPAVALQSLGHPTPPGHFATCSWGSLMLFYHQVTMEQLRLQFGVEALLKRDFFFNIIVDKIGWKYTWTIGIYLNVVTGPCSTAFMSKLRTSSSNKNNPVGKARRWIWRLQNNLVRQQWLPFSPRLFKHKFIVCRVLRVMGFLFDYIPSNFLLMAIWKNPVGRIWGTLQTSWASESLGLLQKAKRTENISHRDCTKWEGWRW